MTRAVGVVGVLLVGYVVAAVGSFLAVCWLLGQDGGPGESA